MIIQKQAQRLLAFSAVAAVWTAAGAVGIWIGLDLGRAMLG